MILWLFSIFSVFYAVYPLFGNRFIPTHDGEYHIIRFWQYFKMLSSGNVLPRWAPDLANGFGMPLFTFQYPFPNMVGSFLHVFGVSFVHGVQWTLGLGYLTALLFCYLWLSFLWGKRDALLGTIVGAFVPYWFVDLYVRGSVGEVWAIAWVFAGLWCIARKKKFLLMLTVGLLITSHNILAMVFVPVMLVYAMTKNRPMLPFALLGIGAAAFFWIPALYEQRFIRGISTVNVFDHFPEVWQLLIPSWGTGFRGETTGTTEMSYQIGIVPLFVLGLTALAAVRKKQRLPLEVILAVTGSVLMVVFLLPVSYWFWRSVPLLSFVQYPWRLLSVLLIAVPVSGAYVSHRFRFGWILAVLAVLVSASYAKPVTYEPRTDAHYLTNPAFTGGTSSLGNAFTTIWMNGSTTTNPPVFSIENGRLSIESVAPTHYILSMQNAEQTTVTAPITYYPGWEVNIDSKRIVPVPNDRGLVSFRLEPGVHHGEIFLEQTALQKIALGISILSLSVGLLFTILKQ